MRPEQILQHFVFPATVGVHQTRLNAIVSASAAIIDAGSAVPAHVGRSLAHDTTPKHGIKRMDRLLGNERLHAQLPLLYKQIARTIVGERPIILVDWTKLDGGKQVALALALIGTLVEHLGLHRHFQANTVRNRLVLSLINLGGLALTRPRVMRKLGVAWLEFAISQAVDFSSGPAGLTSEA